MSSTIFRIISLVHCNPLKAAFLLSDFCRLLIDCKGVSTTIPLYIVERLLTTMYKEFSLANTPYRKKHILLDIAICETLFSTGMRISELCNLKISDVELYDATIRIYGKGAKERMIQIGNTDVLLILEKYEAEYSSEINKSGYFFVNPNATQLSDQAIRRMIKKYCSLASIDLHITPHMFRHTFATSLLSPMSIKSTS